MVEVGVKGTECHRPRFAMEKARERWRCAHPYATAYQQALIDQLLQGKTVREVAESLGVTSHSIYMQLSDAQRRWRRATGQDNREVVLTCLEKRYVPLLSLPITDRARRVLEALLRGKTMRCVAREEGVSAARIHEIVRNAERRYRRLKKEASAS